MNRCARSRASRSPGVDNWISSTRRAPYDAPRPAAALDGRYRASAHCGPPARVSLVSQDVRRGFYRVLPGDRTVPVDLPVDRILGRQLFLRPVAADEGRLGQRVCARRRQRPGNGQSVYFLRRDLPPAALRETLSEATPADRRRFHRLRLPLSVPLRFQSYRRQPAAHPAARLAGQDRPLLVARRRREPAALFSPWPDRGTGSDAPLAKGKIEQQ